MRLEQQKKHTLHVFYTKCHKKMSIFTLFAFVLVNCRFIWVVQGSHDSNETEKLEKTKHFLVELVTAGTQALEMTGSELTVLCFKRSQAQTAGRRGHRDLE